MNTRLSRRRQFQTLRRYAAEAWADAGRGRAATAGACFVPGGHGHAYQLEIVLEGAVDPASGMIVNLIDVDRALADTLAPLEGRHLDEALPYFRSRAPSTENLAAYLFTELTRLFEGGPARLAKLRLFESADLWVDLWA